MMRKEILWIKPLVIKNSLSLKLCEYAVIMNEYQIF